MIKYNVDICKWVLRHVFIFILFFLKVERRIDLVYGGGSVGLMGLVSQAVHDGGRHVLGYILYMLRLSHTHGDNIYISPLNNKKHYYICSVSQTHFSFKNAFRIKTSAFECSIGLTRMYCTYACWVEFFIFNIREVSTFKWLLSCPLMIIIFCLTRFSNFSEKGSFFPPQRQTSLDQMF